MYIHNIDIKQVDYCCNYVTTNGEALFTFQTQNKSLCCIRLPALQSNTSISSPSSLLPTKIELNQPNFVQRLGLKK